MTLHIPFENDLADYLAKALSHNRLELYSQPIFHLATQSFVSSEVLLRVPYYSYLDEDSSKHLKPLYNITTDEWIRAANNQGLILPITQWLVKRVLDYLEASTSMHLPLFINVPPTLIDFDFIKFLEAETRERFLSPSLLGIEITESQKPADLPLLKEAILELKDLGHQVVIDDFGAGYATMQYLLELPVHGVKIDRSFLQNATAYKDGAFMILQSLVTLAKEMGLHVTCEGVENKQDLLVAMEVDCDAVQGFYIQQPAAIEEETNTPFQAASKLIH